MPMTYTPHAIIPPQDNLVGKVRVTIAQVSLIDELKKLSIVHKCTVHFYDPMHLISYAG